MAGAFKPREATMRAPYGLNILDNCMTCPAKGEHLFCNLSLQAGERLNEIKSTAVYPKGAMLFIEGQQSRGVFVLCSGKVKLSTTSREVVESFTFPEQRTNTPRDCCPSIKSMAPLG